MTADIILLADHRPGAAPLPAPALVTTNAASAAAMLVTACRTLAVSLSQISESCSVVRDRMSHLHDGAEAAVASAGEVIAATQALAGFGRSFREADHA